MAVVVSVVVVVRRAACGRREPFPFLGCPVRGAASPTTGPVCVRAADPVRLCWDREPFLV